MGAERHVKFFRNGNDQAVVIPAEFAMPGDGAVIRKEGDRLVIEPEKKTDLLEWLSTIEPWDEEFPDFDIDEPPPRDVDL